MTCENGLTQEDIESAAANIKAVNLWAEGDSSYTATMANGRQVPSPAKVIADGKMFKMPITWSAGLSVTDALQTYENGGFLYAPLPSALPFTTGVTFNGANWYTIQSIVVSGGSIDFQSGKGINLADGTNPNDATNLQQMEAADVVAVSDAATYTDGEIAALDAFLQAYADAGDAATLASADAYTDAQIALLSNPLPMDSRFGCELENITTAATNRFNFSAGKRRSDDDTVNMILAADLEKLVFNNFAAGDGNGGRSSLDALTADTNYQFYLISTADGLTTDVIMATSRANALGDANAIAGSYVKARRISKVKSRPSISTFWGFYQRGDDFMLALEHPNSNGAFSTTLSALPVDNAPADSLVMITVSANLASATGFPAYLLVSGTGGLGTANPPSVTLFTFGLGAVGDRQSTGMTLGVNAASEILTQCNSSGAGGVFVQLQGWRDARLD